MFGSICPHILLCFELAVGLPIVGELNRYAYTTICLMQYSILWRVVGALIDWGIFYGVILLYLFLFGTPDGSGTYRITGPPAFGAFIVIAILWFVYFPVAETFARQTVGKAIVGLQVTGASQVTPGIVEMTKRRLADVVDFTLWGIVGLIAINKTEKRQRIGDLWAETMVVRTEVATCPHCEETAHLEGPEVIRRSYRCPSCGEYVQLGSRMHG